MKMDMDKMESEEKQVPVAIYGLGTETKRFLAEYGERINVAGLLDGFRTDGEMYDYPIISLDQVIEQGVKLIIVVARPGSCKAIAKTIGDTCRENGVSLYDVRGNDLLDAAAVAFDFSAVKGNTLCELYEKIDTADIISFDLFDTLVMRKTLSYTDVFELLECRLREMGIDIPDFSKLRLSAEKKLSKDVSPKLEEIYAYLIEVAGVSGLSASKLAELEWETDQNLFTVREAVRDVYKHIISVGSKVVITTDNYYTKEQIVQVLERFNLFGYDDLLVSCEYGTYKTQQLFGILREKYKGKTILHIGDDEYADIEKAKENGLEAYRIYSATDLFDALGGLGIEADIVSVADHVKVGMFLADIFNSPFWFDEEGRRVPVKNSFNIGYLFCAPMITDFIQWMKESSKVQGYGQILLGARDGYLPNKLCKMADESENSLYFLTSRTAAIRAGMETQEDINYVDSMMFSGTPEQAMWARFGIDMKDIVETDRTSVILGKAQQQRENYHKYIEKLGIKNTKLAFFDFVAKGTTQLYLQKLFSQHMKGFYFLQLEPEFMADKGLDIEPFYSDEEKNKSSIFENYYILETILTSPYPQLLEMDDKGEPIYATETRSERDLDCFDRAQRGIIEYFADYIKIVPQFARQCNKKLDEKLLALVNKVQILDNDFLSLKVEDPFFGRMTDMKNVL